MRLLLRLSTGERVVDDAAEMLARRASLPGAFGWDQAAHVLRVLQAEGVGGVELLPLALPTSWMVNAKASSRTFRAWLTPRWLAAFSEVLVALDPATPWPDLDTSRVQAAVDELGRAPGAGLAAITKVLALLRPTHVPLMDDAALAAALGVVDVPTTDDEPSAPTAHFSAMMDWFPAESIRNEGALVALARGHQAAVLDGPQVLDRVLWYVAYGHRHFVEPMARPVPSG